MLTVDIFNEIERELGEEIAKRIRRNCELVISYLHYDVPIEIEIEETVKDVELRAEEAKIVESALEVLLKEKRGEESNKNKVLNQCAWWVGNESLFLYSVAATLRRALEELRRLRLK
jgi:hypothetical protein